MISTPHFSVCNWSLEHGKPDAINSVWVLTCWVVFMLHVAFHQDRSTMLYKLGAQLTCLIVTAGRQSLSSSNNDRHTVPDGYTLGWNIGGSNLPV